MSNKNNNKKDCCGGHVGTKCQCGSFEDGTLTREEQETLELIRLVLSQGRRKELAKQKLYDDMLADADVTNI